jgi:predicted O-linked N-acetylglucosamine transferase (SPINDLY family)
MRLLREIPGSVLWLPSDDPVIMINLRKEASARAVTPERLVFAKYAKRAEDHLARQRLADLFLDTAPYNAHSTAGDALWVGLPVLTCMGKAFQARVAASLLRAADLPELVTMSLADYEQCALALARDAGRLASIREKLTRNRRALPLFDMAGFTRDLENIYNTMWERLQSGHPPESFSIAKLPQA